MLESFQRHMRHNVLPTTDATEDAASVVALKTLRRDFHRDSGCRAALTTVNPSPRLHAFHPH